MRVNILAAYLRGENKCFMFCPLPGHYGGNETDIHTLRHRGMSTERQSPPKRAWHEPWIPTRRSLVMMYRLDGGRQR